MPFLDIYVSEFPFPTSGDIFPLQKKEEIERCQSQKSRDEKYYVWKLLEFALQKSLNLSIQTLKFIKQVNGKWTLDECYFSLSHSGNLVSVAISDKPVGLDIQIVHSIAITSRLIDLVLTSNEKEKYPNITAKRLSELWSLKECAFKKSEDRNFVPNRYESGNLNNFKVLNIKAGNDLYKLSALCDNISNVRFFKNIK